MFQLYIYIHKQNKKTRNKIQSIPDLEHCILNLPNTNLSTALAFLFSNPSWARTFKLWRQRQANLSEGKPGRQFEHKKKKKS